MADTLYQYDYPGPAFPALVASAPNAETIEQSILYTPAITIALRDISIGVTPGKCDVWFVDPLPAPDQAALEAILAANTGVGTASCLTGTIPIQDQVVTDDLTWKDMAGLITTPTFFTSDLSQLYGRVLGECNTDGATAEIQVVESVTGQADAVIGTIILPDTGGTWQKFAMSTTVDPRAGLHNIYTVQGRCNGTTNFSVRFSAISMVLERTYDS